MRRGRRPPGDAHGREVIVEACKRAQAAQGGRHSEEHGVRAPPQGDGLPGFVEHGGRVAPCALDHAGDAMVVRVFHRHAGPYAGGLRCDAGHGERVVAHEALEVGMVLAEVVAHDRQDPAAVQLFPSRAHSASGTRIILYLKQWNFYVYCRTVSSGCPADGHFPPEYGEEVQGQYARSSR